MAIKPELFRFYSITPDLKDHLFRLFRQVNRKTNVGRHGAGRFVLSGQMKGLPLDPGRGIHALEFPGKYIARNADRKDGMLLRGFVDCQ